MFIILGLIILASIGTVIYIYSSNNNAPPDIAVTPIKQEKPSFDLYAKQCIQDIATPMIIKMGEQGGTLRQLVHTKLPQYNGYYAVSAVNYFRTEYRYFCMNDIVHGCVNNLITRDDMQKELSEAMKEEFRSCLNLDDFRRQGYSIEEGPLDIETTIAVDEVNILVKYPLKISRAGKLTNIDNFLVALDMPLGRLYDLANYITNEEITKNTFNKDDWMAQKGAQITIEKHKPYPDVVYKLNIFVKATNKEYEFNFAIQGYDSASLVGKENPTLFRDYCYIEADHNCYANSVASTCTSKGGQYLKSPSDCKGLAQFADSNLCDGKPCKNCTDKNGNIVESGSSWCVYDSIVGMGFDRAGSRHFQGSCINGIFYNEECRDYREEMCTTDEEKSACRVNRWQDCVKQTTKESCENINERDCMWYSWLKNTQGNEAPRCGPAVTPGLKFWEGNGGEICDFANDMGKCRQNEADCPNDWVDTSAFYCYSMGDCGNYRNYLGKLTEDGFINSDNLMFQKQVARYIYLDEDLRGDDYSIRLPINYTNRSMGTGYSQHLYQNDSYIIHPTDEEMRNYVKAFTDEVSSWKACDMDDFCECDDDTFECKYHAPCICGPSEPDKLYSIFKKYIIGLSKCDLWQAPASGDCQSCNEDPFKPCSEYRCKSISKKCIYSEDIENGVGRCTSAQPDSRPLSIEFARDSSHRYRFEDEMFKWRDQWINGKKLNPMKVNNEIEFQIKTSRRASCTIYQIPDDTLPVSLLTAATPYGRTHNLSFSMPQTELLISSIKDILNLTTLYEPFGVQNIPTDSTTANIFGDSNLKSSLQWLAASAEGRQFYLFVRCIDTYGTNSIYTFLTFQLDVDDANPPTITLLNPVTSAYAGEMDFKYKAEDDKADYMVCSLYYNKTSANENITWDIEASKTTYNNTETTINNIFTPGTYVWNIGCSDGINLAFAGENKTMEII